MKRKIVAMLLSFTTALGCVGMTACGGKSSTDNGGGLNRDDYGDRPRSFTFSYYAGGYGADWIEDVCDDYMRNVNQEVFIDLKRNTNNETARTNIQTGVGAYDLYRIEVDLFNMSNSLVDLTDLYDMEVYGEEGVKVKDKIDARWLDYYEEGGHWYQLPTTQLTGWNWVYNVDTLNATLGEGKWNLPKTTNEFFAFGDELYSKGVYLSAFPGADTAGGDYTRYAFELWFAQMVGLKGYTKFMSGYYMDEATGEWKFSSDGPQNVSTNSGAITEAYKIIEKLCSKAKGASATQYMHAQSAGMQFKDVDVLLYGGKYKGTKVPPIAFAYLGGWTETEVAPFVEAGTIDGNQKVLAMRMPVISAIISRTPTIPDEQTLSKVVDYVDTVLDGAPDAAKKALIANVSDADIEIIREARSMVPELICRQFAITKKAKNVDDIKDFLAYLCSDRAQEIAAAATRGISQLPYGYEPTEEDMAKHGVTISDFTKSMNKIAKSATIVDEGCLNLPYRSFFALNWYIEKASAGGTISLNMFTGQAESSATIAQSTYDKLNSTYSIVMEQFLEKYGNNW